MSSAEARFFDALASGLEAGLAYGYGQRMGFALIIFPFNQPGYAGYVSNGQRQDVIKALRKAADKLEAGQEIGPVVGEA